MIIFYTAKNVRGWRRFFLSAWLVLAVCLSVPCHAAPQPQLAPSSTPEIAVHNVAAAFFAPDLSESIKRLACGGTTITVYAGKPSKQPYRLLARDQTVFTAGSAGRVAYSYFYPQAVTATSIQLRAETDYFDLKKSKPVSVTVTGLAPNTVYFYRVQDSDEVHRFRTKPAAGVFAPMQFVVIGDTQGPYDSEGDRNLNKDRFAPGSFANANLAKNAAFNLVTKAIRACATPDLVPHVGDIVEDARYWDQWSREMFSSLKYLLTLAPVYPAMGNHEQHDSRFYRYFEVPISVPLPEPRPQPAFYSFDWGNVHFIFLYMSAHWYTIYDIDQVPAETGLSCDMDGFPHAYTTNQVKAGAYTITDESLGFLEGHLAAERIRLLNALKGTTLDRKAFQRRLAELGFNAAEDRKIRTAAILGGSNRNVASGRIELLIKRGELEALQLDWLRRDLKENNSKQYIFVFNHHPHIDKGKPRWIFPEIFEEYRVSASFSGHKHEYHHDLRNGVHYFTTGGGSDKGWSHAPSGEADIRKRKESDEESFVFHRYGPQFMIVNVEADCATALGVGLDNTIFEKTVIAPRR